MCEVLGGGGNRCSHKFFCSSRKDVVNTMGDVLRSWGREIKVLLHYSPPLEEMSYSSYVSNGRGVKLGRGITVLIHSSHLLEELSFCLMLPNSFRDETQEFTTSTCFRIETFFAHEFESK